MHVMQCGMYVMSFMQSTWYAHHAIYGVKHKHTHITKPPPNHPPSHQNTRRPSSTFNPPSVCICVCVCRRGKWASVPSQNHRQLDVLVRGGSARDWSMCLCARVRARVCARVCVHVCVMVRVRVKPLTPHPCARACVSPLRSPLPLLTFSPSHLHKAATASVFADESVALCLTDRLACIAYTHTYKHHIVSLRS